MVIHNEIFDSYRMEQKEIEKAKELLKKNDYLVFKKQLTDKSKEQ